MQTLPALLTLVHKEHGKKKAFAFADLAHSDVAPTTKEGSAKDLASWIKKNVKAGTKGTIVFDFTGLGEVDAPAGATKPIIMKPPDDGRNKEEIIPGVWLFLEHTQSKKKGHVFTFEVMNCTDQVVDFDLDFTGTENMSPCPISCPGATVNGMKVRVTVQPYETKTVAILRQTNPHKKANLVYETGAKPYEEPVALPLATLNNLGEAMADSYKKHHHKHHHKEKPKGDRVDPAMGGSTQDDWADILINVEGVNAQAWRADFEARAQARCGVCDEGRTKFFEHQTRDEIATFLHDVDVNELKADAHLGEGIDVDDIYKLTPYHTPKGFAVVPTIVTSCKVACFEEWLRLFEKDAARRETFCNNAKTRWFVNGDEIVVIMHDMNPIKIAAACKDKRFRHAFKDLQHAEVLGSKKHYFGTRLVDAIEQPAVAAADIEQKHLASELDEVRRECERLQALHDAAKNKADEGQKDKKALDDLNAKIEPLRIKAQTEDKLGDKAAALDDYRLIVVLLDNYSGDPENVAAQLKEARDEIKRLQDTIRAMELREQGEELLADGEYEAAAERLKESHDLFDLTGVVDEIALANLKAKLEELKARAKAEAGRQEFAAAEATIDLAIKLDRQGDDTDLVDFDPQLPLLKVYYSNCGKLQQLREAAHASYNAKHYDPCMDACQEGIKLAVKLGNKPVREELQRLYAAAARRNEADTLRARGEALLADKKYADAAAVLSESLALADDDTVNDEQILADRLAHADKLKQLAQAEVSLKHYAAAVELLKTAVALAPEDGEAKLMGAAARNLREAQKLEKQGLALVVAKDYQAAQKAFEAALALTPGNPPGDTKLTPRLEEEAARARRLAKANTLRQEGEALLKDGKPKEAAVKLWLAARINPEDDKAAADIHDADEMMAMRNIAKRLKKKARQLGQNCDGEFEALKALGRAQMEAGEHAKALGSFTSAKELKPQDAPVAALIKEAKRQLAKDAALKKAKGELAVKDFEEAAADFQKALDLDPKDAAVAALVQECERKAKAQNLRKIGEAELADKDYENAANTLLSALFLNPDDETAVVEHDEALAKAQAMELQRAGEQLMANQDFEHAIRVFVEALELFPDSKDIADEEQDAERQFQVENLKRRGLLEMDSGHYSDAAETFATAVRLEGVEHVPDPAHAGKMAQTELVVLRGDAEKLAEAYRLQAKGDSELYYGSYAPAVESYTRALQLDPHTAKTGADLVAPDDGREREEVCAGVWLYYSHTQRKRTGHEFTFEVMNMKKAAVDFELDFTGTTNMTPCPVSCPGTVINGMKVNVTLQPYERKVLAYVKQSDPHKKANLVYETDFTEYAVSDAPVHMHEELVLSKAEAERLLAAEVLRGEGEALLVGGQFPEAAAKLAASLALHREDAVAAEKDLAEFKGRINELKKLGLQQLAKGAFAAAGANFETAHTLDRQAQAPAHVPDPELEPLSAATADLAEVFRLREKGEAELAFKDYPASKNSIMHALARFPAAGEPAVAAAVESAPESEPRLRALLAEVEGILKRNRLVEEAARALEEQNDEEAAKKLSTALKQKAEEEAARLKYINGLLAKVADLKALCVQQLERECFPSAQETACKAMNLEAKLLRKRGGGKRKPPAPSAADKELPALKALAGELGQIKHEAELGDSLQAAKKYRPASEAFQKALAQEPTALAHAEALKVDAHGYVHTLDLLQKKAAVDQLAEAEDLKLEGVAHLEAGDYKEAAAALYKSAALVPDSGVMELESEADKQMADHNVARRLKAGLGQRAHARLNRAKALKKKGKKQLAAGDVAKALANFELAQKLSSDDELPALVQECKKRLSKDALVKQGKAEDAAKTYAAAIGSFEKALAIDPADKEVQQLLLDARRKQAAAALKKQGEDCLAHGKFKEAAALLKQCLDIAPEDGEASKERDEALDKQKALDLEKLGMAAYDEGKYPEAVRVLLAALACDPENERIAEEEAQAERMLQATADKAAALEEMAKDNYPAAVLILVQAIEEDPRDAELKKLLLDAEKLAEADRLKSKADAELYYRDVQDAVTTYRQALAVIEGVPDMLFALESTPEYGHEHAELHASLAIAERLLKAQKLQQEGERAMAEGDHAKAVECFMAAVALDPANEKLSAEEADASRAQQADELTQQGIALLEAEDFADAVLTFDAAIKVLGTDVEPAGDGLVVATLAKKKKKEALRLAEARDLSNHADAELYFKDYPLAIATYALAIKLEPPNRAALEKSKAEAEQLLRAHQLKQEGEALLADGKFKLAADKLKDSLALHHNEEAQEEETLASLKASIEDLKARCKKEIAGGLYDEAMATATTATSLATSAEDFQPVGAEDAEETELIALKDAAEALASVFRLREKGEAEMYYIDPAAAVDSLVEALEVFPELPADVTSRESKPEIEALLKLARDKLEAQRLQAEAERLLKMQQAEEAAKKLAEALRRASDDEAVRLQEEARQLRIAQLKALCKKRIADKEFADAAHIAEQGAQVAPDDADFPVLLALALLLGKVKALAVKADALADAKKYPAAAASFQQAIDAELGPELKQQANGDAHLQEGEAPMSQLIALSAVDKPELMRKRDECLKKARAKELQDEGRALLAAGKPKEAAAKLWNSAALDPLEETLHLEADCDGRLVKENIGKRLKAGADALRAHRLAEAARLKQRARSLVAQAPRLPEQETQDCLGRALEAAEKGSHLEPDAEFDELIALIKKLMEKDALVRKSDSQISAKDYADAVGSLEAALALDAEDARTQQKLARAKQLLKCATLKKAGEGQLANKAYEEAAKTLAEALGCMPEDEELAAEATEAAAKAKAARLQKQGEEALKKGDFEDAVHLFSDALVLDPTNATITDEEREAEKDLEVERLRALGLQQLDAADFGQAAATFEIALTLLGPHVTRDKQTPDKACSAELAGLAKSCQRGADAKRLKEAGDAELYYHDYPDAIESYSAALRLNPVDSEEIRKSKEMAQRLLKADELHKEGERLMKEDKFAEAAAKLHESLALKGDNAVEEQETLAKLLAHVEELKNKAQDAIQDGLYAPAVADLTTAIELASHYDTGVKAAAPGVKRGIAIAAPDGAEGAGSAGLTLEDGTVSISPYFEVLDMEKFKATWKAAYEPFAHREDCVHYAFTFDGNNAHCREAYTNADKVLQHLADVDAQIKAVLDPAVAKLQRIEVHGPAAEIEKLREPLTPLGALFYVCEWGFRPQRAAQAEDTGVHLYPYFSIEDGAVGVFKKIWGDAYESTKAAQGEENSLMYAFAFQDDGHGQTALCREAYADAASLLLHVKNVDAPLKGVLDPAVAKLLRLEVHGPASEIEALKPALAPLGAQFFTTEWGFRNSSPGASVEVDPELLALPWYPELAELLAEAERLATTEKLKNKAEAEMEVQEYAAAIEDFAKALDLDPEDHTGSMATNKAECERLLRAAELQAEGEKLLAEGKWAPAAEKLAASLAARQDDAVAEEEAFARSKMKGESLKDLCKKQLADGQYPSAVATAKAAIVLDPEDLELPVLLAEAERMAEARRLEEEGDHELKAKNPAEALSDYLAALHLDPESKTLPAKIDEAKRLIEAKNLKEEGEGLLDDGHPKEAAAKLLKALSLDPDDSEAQKTEVAAEDMMIGRNIARRLKQNKGKRDKVKAVTALRDDGVAKQSKGKLKDAANCYEAALILVHKNPELDEDTFAPTTLGEGQDTRGLSFPQLLKLCEDLQKAAEAEKKRLAEAAAKAAELAKKLAEDERTKADPKYKGFDTMPNDKLVHLIFAVVDRDHSAKLDGEEFGESFDAGKVFADRRTHFDADHFQDTIDAHWKDLAVLVHDNGVCTEDFVAFMKVLEDKMGDKFHPYLVDLLFHAGLDPADEVEGAKPAEEAAPAQEAEGEPAVADDGKFEGDYDGTPDQKQLAWIKDALGEDCPPLDKDASLQGALEDGMLLCLLANKLKPGAVRRIQKPRNGKINGFAKRGNISSALDGFRKCGVHDNDLFTPDDLLNGNMRPVELTIDALGRASYDVEGYKGPCLGHRKKVFSGKKHFVKETVLIRSGGDLHVKYGAEKFAHKVGVTEE